jgi:16S rRNA (cytidine1402-2'-O)-methyltransferase
VLTLVATPIGNLKDITVRALEALREAAVIICEDTRETGKLLKRWQIPPKPLISFYEEVENKKQAEILEMIREDNFSAVLVCDAGTPLISDPGYKLVREAIKQGIKVTAVPGPAAAIAALTISGLPPDKFLFLGYPPEKDSHQRRLYGQLTTILRIIVVTVIFYVSPHKLKKNLAIMREVFGDIEITLCRELTKIYEERWTGKISEALVKFKNPRGEFVLLFNLNGNAGADSSRSIGI